MSNTSSDNSSLVLAIIVICCAIAAFVIWKFGQLIGVDFETSFKQILCIITILLFVAFNFYLSTVDDRFSLTKTWPILVFFLYLSIFPTVNYWANQGFSLEDRGYWWYSWYSKLLLGVCAAGIYFISVKDR